MSYLSRCYADEKWTFFFLCAWFFVVGSWRTASEKMSVSEDDVNVDKAM